MTSDFGRQYRIDRDHNIQHKTTGEWFRLVHDYNTFEWELVPLTKEVAASEARKSNRLAKNDAFYKKLWKRGTGYSAMDLAEIRRRRAEESGSTRVTKPGDVDDPVCEHETEQCMIYNAEKDERKREREAERQVEAYGSRPSDSPEDWMKRRKLARSRTVESSSLTATEVQAASSSKYPTPSKSSSVATVRLRGLPFKPSQIKRYVEDVNDPRRGMARSNTLEDDIRDLVATNCPKELKYME